MKDPTEVSSSKSIDLNYYKDTIINAVALEVLQLWLDGGDMDEWL